MNVPFNDDTQSFLDAMQDVKPIAKTDKAQLHDPSSSLEEKKKHAALKLAEREKINNPLSMEGVKPVPVQDFIEFQQPGIQDGVFKKLRLGKYPLEFTLNLKGKTLNESREQVYNSLLQCHEKGIRALIIQHGTGENSKPFPGVKRSYINHWLREMAMVIAFHTAQPMHGGFGATYVLLKKHPQQKLINREKNRKR